MLNSVDEPRSHWLLKAPIHVLFLDTLLHYYPSASLVMTHRQLDEVLPSFVRLFSVFMSIYLNNNRAEIPADKTADTKRLIQTFDTLVHRLIKFRRAHQHNAIFDIHYNDLVERPIDTVRHLYDHFGFQWSNEFEQEMIVWLEKNPQGKQGRNMYRLEEFGLTRDEIEQNYNEYNNMFLELRK
ncbi:unnamed protein product [Adineta ricciae]|uniref:Sulfotransferase n=2 Tax=Adineta ricciae TaxID=249248 RepID=A0A815IGE3_ADIRI|nr:unnamed protein product [Adineta ricciae]